MVFQPLSSPLKLSNSYVHPLPLYYHQALSPFSGGCFGASVLLPLKNSIKSFNDLMLLTLGGTYGLFI